MKTPIFSVRTHDELEIITYELRIPVYIFEETDLDDAILKATEGSRISNKLRLLANIMEQYEKRNNV